MTCVELQKENEMLKDLLLNMILENTKLEMEITNIKDILKSITFDKV